VCGGIKNQAVFPGEKQPEWIIGAQLSPHF